MALLDPAARARGFATATILNEWSTVVGGGLARRCRPLAIRHAKGRRGGMLILEAGNAAALELQHAAPQILERVNRYFGWDAVSGLRFVAGTAWEMSAEPRAPPPPRPDAAALANLTAGLEAVSDPALRDALLALGMEVHGSCGPPFATRAPDLAARRSLA